MESFLSACGARGPLLLDIEGPGLAAATRLSFVRPYVLIGRDDRADLVFDHDAVSRRHVFLQVVEGRLFFVDLESRTGTTLEGTPAEAGWFEAGQTLAVGPYTLRVVPLGDGDGWAPPPADPPRQNPLLARSAEAYDLPKVALEFQSRTSGHSIWRMNPLLALVGSSPRCKVRLLDSNVSKLHAALVRTSAGLWVVDLLGRGGITINGATLRAARLNPGDLLGLGQVIVRPTFEDKSFPEGAAIPLPRPGPAAGSGSGSGSGSDLGLGSAGDARPGPETPNLPRPRTPRVWTQPASPPSFQPPATFPTDALGNGTALSTNEPALALLLSHFGQMQQQMIDQFQQTMMMMVQMFGGMHREQMGLMREELDRLRELNAEMASIKAELAGQPGSGMGMGMGSGTGRSRAVAPASIAKPPPGPPYHFGGKSRTTNGQHPPIATGSKAGSSSSSSTAPNPTAAQAESSASPPPEAPPLEPAADVHDWLNERLTAITTEQQNRWQRVMNMIRGGEK